MEAKEGSTNTGYTVRLGKKEDMSWVVPLVEAEGWNDTIEHLLFQLELFPEGVVVAESSNGEIISHCTSSPLDDSTGFISFYVTKKSWRGKGIGRKVFNLSCKALGNRQISLNAAWNRQAMYESGGFKVSSFSLVTYDCAVEDVVLSNERFLGTDLKIFPLAHVHFQEILAYDKKIHPMDRTEILRWFVDFAYVGLVAMEKEKVIGWGSLYKASRGFRFMPLYADSFECSKVLAVDLLRSISSNTEAGVEIAFPSSNANAKKLFDELNITSGREHFNRRMFTEQDIPIPGHLVYSILNYDNVLI